MRILKCRGLVARKSFKRKRLKRWKARLKQRKKTTAIIMREAQEPEYFDREDIEVAVDAFISHLIQAKVVRKSIGGKFPSFSEVFEKYFGDAHEITVKAKNFEEYVEGYFGAISPDDMSAAHDEFCEIQEAVRKELGGDDAEN